MESKELFYILVIIILVLHFFCNNKDTFVNLRKDHKKKVGECCKGKRNCTSKPKFLKGENCEENKRASNKKLVKQYDSKFNSSDEYNLKRPNFEGVKNKPETYQVRLDKLKKAVNTQVLFNPFEYINSTSKSGKPGFYVRKL